MPGGRFGKRVAHSASRIKTGKRLGLAVLTLGFLLLTLAGLTWLVLSGPRSPAPARADQNRRAGGPVHAAPASEQAYEEYQDLGLENGIKRIDALLLAYLTRQGLDPESLEVRDVVLKQAGGGQFHYQTLDLTLDMTLEQGQEDFCRDLEAWLSRREPRISLLPSPGGSCLVSLGAIPTHRIFLHEASTSPRPDPPVSGQLAIIIDDIGEDASFVHGLAGLDMPLTVAVWPHSSQGIESARAAFTAGMDVLLHQPMEPRRYPVDDPGQGAVFVNMTREKILATLDRNLAQVPHAVGVNNHMGSRFTEFPAGMRAVMSVIRDRGLVYLDSLTTPASVAASEAGRARVPFYRRDVFLDNVREVDAIVHQLNKAERLAASAGRAVAIGHPHPETLQALEIWYTSRKPGTIPVRLTALPTDTGRVPHP